MNDRIKNILKLFVDDETSPWEKERGLLCVNKNYIGKSVILCENSGSNGNVHSFSCSIYDRNGEELFDDIIPKGDPGYDFLFQSYRLISSKVIEVDSEYTF